jgi:hypothetical protein
MAGDAQSPWVGDSLAIHKYQVWLRVQFLERLHQQWDLPKRQQTWDIGKANRRFDDRGLDNPKIGVVQRDGNGPARPWTPSWTESDVASGYDVRRIDKPRSNHKRR